MPIIFNAMTYHSVSEVTSLLNVSRPTVLRWIRNGKTQTGEIVTGIRDTLRNRYFVSDESVQRLLKLYDPANRFIIISDGVN